MIGYCNCKNLKVTWDLRDLSLTPRACQCDFCLSHNVQWLSKSGSKFELSINLFANYEAVQTGTKSAVFHKCSYCQTIIATTVTIDRIHYGAVNLNCLNQKHRFPKARPTIFDNVKSANERKIIWQQNWCSPATINMPPAQLTPL